MHLIRGFNHWFKFAVFAAIMGTTALVSSTVSAAEPPGGNGEIRDCIQQAREAFLAELRSNRNGNNGHTAQAIRAAVEAFRDSLAECRGEGVETDPCWQSAREAFLDKIRECRNPNSRRVSTQCVRAAVQALVDELKACRGDHEAGETP
jgi:hypothetical protein